MFSLTTMNRSDGRSVLTLGGQNRLVLLLGCSTLLASAPSAAQAVRVEHVEVVQVIQNSKGSVPLLEGKRTAVRVYLSGSVLRPVHGSLRLQSNDGTLVRTYQSSSPGSPAGSFNLRSLRERRGASLDFHLPGAEVRRGSVVLEVTSIRDAATGVTIPCNNCPRASTASFKPAPILRLLLISYRYSSPGQKNVVPRDVDLLAAEKWIEKTYPVRSISVQRRLIDAQPGWEKDCHGSNLHVDQIRATDMRNNADPRTHYLVLVSDGGSASLTGCSNKIPPVPDPSAVATAPVGKSQPQWEWDADGTYADWQAGHELGHTLGRSHLGACGDIPRDDEYPFDSAKINNSKTDYVAWDIDLGIPYGNEETHDMMSYCANLWPSAHTYELLYTRLLDEEQIGVSAPAPPALAAFSNPPVQVAPLSMEWEEAALATVAPPQARDTTRWMSIFGVVDTSRQTGEIQAVMDASPDAVRRSELPGKVRLRLRDGTRAVLDSFPVILYHASGATEKNSPVAGFREDILLDERAAVIELVLDNAVIDSVLVSKAAPRVEWLRLAPSSPGDAGTLVFTWDAEAADQDTPLTYTVLVWFDDAEVPETMAVGLAKRRIEIDSGQRMGRLVTRIEVIASDGVRIDRFRSGRLQ